MAYVAAASDIRDDSRAVVRCEQLKKLLRFNASLKKQRMPDLNGQRNRLWKAFEEFVQHHYVPWPKSGRQLHKAAAQFFAQFADRFTKNACFSAV